MQLLKSISFINSLVNHTKRGTILWSPLKRDHCAESFPQLDYSSSFYCTSNNDCIAIGYLLPEYKEMYSDVGIFICINDSRTYSLLEFYDLSDTQDYDLICSKTLRLYNLVSSPDNSLEKFIDNFLSKKK